MNKKYMVKRNALGQAVVASELAKSKGKLSSVAKVVGLAILGLSSSAFADESSETLTTYGRDSVALTGGTAIGAYTKASENGTSIGDQAITGKASIAVGAESYALGGGLSKFTYGELQKFGDETPSVNDYEYIFAKNNFENATDDLNYRFDRHFHDLGYYKLSDIKDGWLYKNYTYKAETSEDMQRYVNDYKKYKNYDEILSNAEKTQNEFISFVKETFEKYINNENTSSYNDDIYENIKTLINGKRNDLLQKFELDYIISTEEKIKMLGDDRFQALMKKIVDWQDTHPTYGFPPPQPEFTEDEKKILNDNFDLVQKYYEYKDTITAANLILNNSSYNGVDMSPTLSAHLNSLSNLNDINSAMKEYSEVVAKYNEEKDNYDNAIAIRNAAESARIANFNEVLKTLNDKTTELVLDKGYINLQQVLGALEGRAIAIGNQAYVSGDEAVGVGYGNTVTSSRSNVLGTHNNVTTANNNVMGNDNNITVSEGNVIIGNAITFAQGVTTSDNIALGSNTVISAPVPTTGVDIQGATYSFAGKNPTSALSIGSEGNERQIQNVAAGRVTKTSTDAINGSQLYAVVEAVNALQAINLDDISVADTNTQATVTAGQGITVTETNNANGTKNYAVSAKLGKGLKVDENGAIAATAQPINGGAGVSITTNAQDEAVVNVAGVTTTTDDGKSYTRSDLTKAVGVKGDGKNIHTSTAANGDVQVQLADEIQIKNIVIQNGPVINQQGIDAVGTRITHVQDGVAPTDAVNVRQLTQQGNMINQRIDNLADHVKKNKKRTDAGIASTAAMTNIPQVLLAGQSGIGVGIGHRDGQSAIAVGYSRASENAKHSVKFSVGMDTQSKATLGAGYMYNW